MKNLSILRSAVLAFAFGLPAMATAQCAGSEDITGSAVSDAIWAHFENGDVEGLVDKLDASGVLSSGLESGLRNVFRQRPEGFSQCSILLRNLISDRLLAEYVVIGDNNSIGFFANIAVAKVGDSERIIRFTIDSNIDPVLYSH